jgi:hypothetical protein
VFLGGALAHCGGSATEPVHGAGIQRAPLAVSALHAVEDRVVDVQLRVVVARVVLEERRGDQAMRVDEPPRGPAVMPTREYPACSAR